MAGRTFFEIEMGKGRASAKRQAEDPARIVVVGDFTPTANRDPTRRFARHEVSVDSLDRHLSAQFLRVEISVSDPFPIEEVVSIQSIDDFHPDSLYRRLPVFQEFAAIDRLLRDSGSETAGLKRLAELTGSDTTPATIRSGDAERGTGEDDADTVDRLLGRRQVQDNESIASRTVDRFVRDAMADASSTTPTDEARRGLEVLHDLRTRTMRSILSAREFRRCESAWRSIDWLTRRIDYETASIELIDIAIDELRADLNGGSDLASSQMSRLLCDVEADRMPDVVAGLFTIEHDLDDLLLASKLGAISSRAGGRFVAHGSLELCGCASIEALDSPNDWSLPDDDTTSFWRELRTHPVFQRTMLVAPRFILRQPYGKKSDPIDSFDFDELEPVPSRNAFLWGNPAVLGAYARATGDFRVNDLPMPIYADSSGQAQQPATEAYVSDRAASAAARCGIHLLRADRTTGEVAIG